MKLAKFRNGQVAILMTLVIAVLLGVIALGSDVGIMYYQHMQLQKATDAAALAGANYLDPAVQTIATTGFIVNPNCTGEPDDAQKAACTYAINNNLATNAQSLAMTETAASATPNTPSIQVVATRTGLPYFFGRLLDLNGTTPTHLSTYNLVASSTAYMGSTGATNGMFPIGMQCTPTCDLANVTPGSPVTFNAKFGPLGEAPGNWQWLDAGNGAAGVGNAITNGMSGTYGVGETIATKPGNIANSQQVSSAFNARFGACPALTGDPCGSGGSLVTIPPTDPCLITVPAVNFNHSGSNPLQIEGFAQVYVEP